MKLKKLVEELAGELAAVLDLKVPDHDCKCGKHLPKPDLPKKTPAPKDAKEYWKRYRLGGYPGGPQ